MNKIISLVPSITESLFDLGLGSKVVGVTDFCIFPKEQVRDIAKVGGPKNIDLAKILGLKPDIVFANQEENNKEDIQQLLSAGLNIKLFFPKTPRDAITDLYDLLSLCGKLDSIEIVRSIERTLDWVETACQEKEPFRYFCPIWMGQHADAGDWWMTFNYDTYPSALLDTFGGKNVFADRVRKYPLAADLGILESEPAGNRDTRYPCVTMEEIRRSMPDILIIPNEPYSFTDKQIDHFVSLFTQDGLPAPRVIKIDGSLLFWPGTRISKALSELAEFLEP